MINTKKSLFKSLLALLLCIAMLMGTTFAWFTDEASSKGNKIQSGTLKVDLALLDAVSGKWTSLRDSRAPIFDYDNWEPGYTDVRVLRVSNEGGLSLKWVARFVSDEELSKLADVIDVYVKPSKTPISYPEDRSLAGYERVGSVSDFVNTIENTTYGMLAAGECAYLGIALKMRTDAGNEYQGLSLGGAFDIRISATQWTGESDSFDEEYDKDATYPSILDQLRLSADITDKVDENGALTEEIKLFDRKSGVLVTIPVGARVEDGATRLSLKLTKDDVYGKIKIGSTRLNSSHLR